MLCSLLSLKPMDYDQHCAGLVFVSLHFPPSDDDACNARHSEGQQEMLMSHFWPWKRFRLSQAAACALCCAGPCMFLILISGAGPT